MDDSILEKKITEALQKRAEDAGADPRAARRLKAEVLLQIEEETHMTKKNILVRNWKKTALAAAAICILGSATAIALSRPSYISGHSRLDEMVTDYQTAAKMQKGFDSSVQTIERFSNGYTFKEAVPLYNTAHDENHAPMESETTMYFRYAKEGMEDVSLDAGRVSLPVETPDLSLTLENGVVLSYKKMANLFVPPDYKPTDEELALSEAGKLNIGYGSSEIENMDSQSVTWTKDGISYSLFTFETKLTAEEMLQMAKEAAEP